MATTKSTSAVKSSKNGASVSKAKSKHSAFGAPAQHNQSSRKGKKAWRKNVDIEQVESGLENMRTEERVTGCVLT